MVVKAMLFGQVLSFDVWVPKETKLEVDKTST